VQETRAALQVWQAVRDAEKSSIQQKA